MCSSDLHISKVAGHEAADGWRRCRPDWHDSDPAAEWSVRLTNRWAALAACTYYDSILRHKIEILEFNLFGSNYIILNTFYEFPIWNMFIRVM